MLIRLLPLLFCLFPTLPARAEQTIVLNTANEPPNATEDFTGIGDRVLAEAFGRLGIRLRIVRLPSERALVNANEGIEDGNFARVAGLGAQYPNLIQVPESITRFELVAISKKLDFPITGWESLQPYNVGFVRGWKSVEPHVAGTKSLLRVTDKHMLFSLLLADRLDLIVYDRNQAMAFLQANPLAEKVIFLKPSLAVQELYPYLHKRHADLVPRLAEAIRAMKKDGTYARLVAEVLSASGQ